MKDEHFDEISKKLDAVIALLSIQNLNDRDKKIQLMKSMEMTSKNIGLYLGLEESVVRKSKGWKI